MWTPKIGISSAQEVEFVLVGFVVSSPNALHFHSEFILQAVPP